MPDELHLHPEVRRRLELLRSYARWAGLTFKVTSAYRPITEQKRLYDAWLKRGKTGLPAAPPGTSTHNYGFAIDAVALRGSQEQLGALASAVGLIWAGAKDPVHFDPFGFEGWRSILREAGVIA